MNERERALIKHAVKIAHENDELHARVAELEARWGATSEGHCMCDACKDGVIHLSDCAVHNAPAYPVGDCNCGVDKSMNNDVYSSGVRFDEIESLNTALRVKTEELATMTKDRDATIAYCNRIHGEMAESHTRTKEQLVACEKDRDAQQQRVIDLENQLTPTVTLEQYNKLHAELVAMTKDWGKIANTKVQLAACQYYAKHLRDALERVVIGMNNGYDLELERHTFEAALKLHHDTSELDNLRLKAAIADVPLFEMEKDAARWCYWRSLFCIDSVTPNEAVQMIERAMTPEELDAAVDAAMEFDI